MKKIISFAILILTITGCQLFDKKKTSDNNLVEKGKEKTEKVNSAKNKIQETTDDLSNAATQVKEATDAIKEIAN